MNKSESKYRNTALKMDKALLALLEKKDFEYITVKELCAKAGVSRSTFYLHYETVGELLDESVEYINKSCFDRYGKLAEISGRVKTADLSELIFISPEYLTPYFDFVKENRRLFSAALARPASFGAGGTFNALFENVFSPVLDRFCLKSDEKPYVISFYIAGLMAIVSRWIKNDCAEPVDRIIDICMTCIPSREHK